MSKLALFLFLVLLCFQANAAFDRPWENRSWIATNPSIFSYGIDIWWDVTELHKTLDTVEFGRFDINGTAKRHWDEALARKEAAKGNLWECSKAKVLAPLLAVMSSAPASSYLYLSTFSSVSNCTEYKNNWINAVDSSLAAAEESMAEAEMSIRASRDAYNQIRNLGLCDVDFTYRPNEYCDGAAAAFASLNHNITEGTYGGFPLCHRYSQELKSELLKPTPDISGTSAIIGLVWEDDGVIDRFTSLVRTSAQTKQDAETLYDSLSSSAAGRKALLEKDIKAMDREKIHLITAAPSGYHARDAGSSSDLLEKLKQKKQDADLEFHEAALERDAYHEYAYLASSIERMRGAASRYEELSQDVSPMLEHARLAVSQKETEAETEIRDARSIDNPSIDTIRHLEMAEENFEKARAASTLGDRFLHFSKAASSARSASEVRHYEGQLMIRTSLSNLQNLIKEAKKDGLNVAEEEESLKMLKNLEPYQIDVYVQSSISSLIAKAKMGYEEDLLERRSRIKDMIMAAGPSAADLNTEMARFEDGIVVNGAIDYPSAIGRLAQLSKDYGYLEAELAQHTREIVGNGMSAYASPLISDVKLDGPAEITLDLVLTNSKGYSAENVPVPISLSQEIPFLYSDIQGDKGSVSGVMLEKGRLVVTFNEIGPFETKRVTLSKKAIIAHTLSRKTENRGLGDGIAYVSEALGFELDIDIPHLELPQGLADPLIDGAIPGRPLSKGKHTLTSEMIIPDAYSVTQRNIKVYDVGLNSKVEYDIEISSTIALASVPIFIDTLNHSEISSFTIFAATGEKIKDKKRISSTQYSANVLDIDKNLPTIIKVSYDVKDTESHVMREILQLQGLNPSDEAKDLLDQANAQADAGNYSDALELVEEFKALSKQQEKSDAKLMDKFKKLHDDLVSELGEIGNALPVRPMNSSFSDKLSARKDELERILAELGNLSLSQKIEALESIDFKWTSKELNTLKKNSYKEYNDLKQRFSEAGNSSTPGKFLEFEDSLNRLEAGARIEYAISAISALEEVRSIVEAQEQAFLFDKKMARTAFESLKSMTEEILDRYLKQASAAKGTDYSSYFSESERKVSSLLKEAEDSLDEDPRILAIKLSSLNSSRRRMESTLDLLENESKAKLSLTESIVGQVEDDRRKELFEKLDLMRKMHQSGDYVNALRAGSAISKELDGYEETEDDGVLILGITAIAVLAAIGTYLSRQKPKKKLKKLPKAETEGLIA